MTAMWQKCPVCDGSGVDPNPPRMDSSAAPHPCGVCKGTRIIGIHDGKPPVQPLRFNLEPEARDG